MTGNVSRWSGLAAQQPLIGAADPHVVDYGMLQMQMLKMAMLQAHQVQSMLVNTQQKTAMTVPCSEMRRRRRGGRSRSRIVHDEAAIVPVSEVTDHAGVCAFRTSVAAAVAVLAAANCDAGQHACAETDDCMDEPPRLLD